MNRLYDEDTIVGISTAQQEGAISIIRISGENSIVIVNKIFKGCDLRSVPSHTIHYGHIIDLNTKEVIDEVLISVFLAPKTYTKENIVEINTHGGIFVTNSVYEQVVLCGARPSEPGEFTKRAFLNGRIDLTQAEAVMDVIESENKSSLRMANHALQGDVQLKVKELKETLIEQISLISASIDYPEYYDCDSLSKGQIMPEIDKIINEIGKIIQASKSAVFIKNGVNTAIVGKPNVGKSSLLNLLLGENRAIVTPIPGTTRDTIEAKINLLNVTLNLVDTAGVHQTLDIVENIGIQKTLEAIEKADLVLFVVDGSSNWTLDDEEIFKHLENKKYIIIENKNDLPKVLQKKFTGPVVSICANSKNDIGLINDAIEKTIQLDKIFSTDITYVSNARQLKKLNDALNCLKEAKKEINENVFLDVVELSLHEAWNSLSEITDVVSNEQFLDELFSRFCLGK